MSTKKKPSPRPQLIEQQARLYGITTRSVVAATFTDRNRAKALACLSRLVRQGHLFRQEYTEHGTNRRSTYYTPFPKPLDPVALRRNFAVLFHCLMTEPRRRLLSVGQGRQLVAALPALRAWKYRRGTRVALEPSGTGQPPRVTLLRISGQASPEGVNPAAVIAQLGCLVASPVFFPWWHFLRAGRFVLTYLVPGHDNTLQLAQRLRRHPLVSSVGGTPQVVPVCFYPAQPLHYASV